MKIACIIPSYNGKKLLETLLVSLKDQSIKHDILIIDSSSTDGTLDSLPSHVKSLDVIPSSNFNHGATRQSMVDANPDYDYYVFLTQDAILADSNSLKNLILPFLDISVGAVCGRQLPHKNATLLSQHARTYNYPSFTQVKSFSDVPKFGIKTAFMSNSFAAYRGTALKDVGGFPGNVIFGEDMYIAAKMLMKGWKVVYEGNAKCFHSHNYSLLEEFQRYFDIGVFHSREPWIRDVFGGAGGEGFRFVISELRFLGLKRFYLWPSSLFRNAAKLLGFKLGLQESFIPIKIKIMLGSYKRYWYGHFATVDQKN